MVLKDLSDVLPLSTKSFHILMAVAERPLNGYQIMLKVEENSDGVVRVGPGTLYESLHRMAENGFVNEVESAGGERANGRGQRFYRISPLGKKVLAAEVDRLSADLRIAGKLRGIRV